MNTKSNPKKWIILVVITLIIASACNLISNISNPVDEVVSEIEDISDDIDIKEIEEDFESIATEFPSDFGDLSGIQATAEAMQEGFEFGEAPPDIPVVEAETENFFGSDEVVSYMTPMEFQDVLDFYQEEMPKNDWKQKKEGTVITENAAVIYYKKQGRDAIVTLSVNPLDGRTVVMVTLQSK